MAEPLPDDCPPHLADAVLDYLRAADRTPGLSAQAFLSTHPHFPGELAAFLAGERSLAALLGLLGGKPRHDPNRTSSRRFELPPTLALAEGLPVLPGYEILSVLGQGGMGVVYKARDIALDRVVAVKCILARMDAASLERFQVEARAVARLEHPAIVSLYSMAEHDGGPFFVMEYVAGDTLAAALKHGPFPPRAAAALLLVLADAVAHAHDQGVVHRDLKPANILLAPAGADVTGCVPKIVDFGLARRLDGAAGLTGAGAAVGTPNYMPPEQARGEAAGPGADVFGLGAILYAMLTARPPYAGETLQQVLDNARLGAVVPLAAARPGLSAELVRICHKALAADPARRYARAVDLREDLRRYLDRPRRQAWAFGLAAAGALAACVALACLLLPWPGPSPRPVPPAPATPLVGELILTLWSSREGDGKQGQRVDEPGALPARKGELLHVEARLNEPAHVYLLLIDTQGETTPLYPWNDLEAKAGLADDPPRRPPVRVVHSPTVGEAAFPGKGWVLDGKDGMETVLLLARREPLPAAVRLAALVGKLPPAPLKDQAAFVVRGGDESRPVDLLVHDPRGVEKKAMDVGDALVRLLHRLRKHFEVVGSVRFAHKGSAD